MVDDSYYITPHEAALAVVATSMKKARLQLDILIINSILGGILFSSGSVLFVACHAENLDMLEKNPGLLNFLGGATFSVGLFYVVIIGAELFNSNILFHSVGLFRGAISVYDLLISWFISWIGNIAGSLFVSYLFIYVSGIAEHENWEYSAKAIAEDKAAYSFMQTFLKGIAGNFFVCLAVYLQLLAKPIHVKFLLMLLPIFTFVSSNYTHVVADMTMFYIGMLCGANVSVGKYVWKLLIPASLGTIIGGAAFGLVIPFYLHLVVVERDRANLSLPEYEARDEQPELNMDSRVVRVPVKEIVDSSDDSDKDNEIYDEKTDNNESKNENNGKSISSSNDQSLMTASRNTSDTPTVEIPIQYSPIRPHTTGIDMNAISRVNTIKSISSHMSKQNKMRSPPGVFPVRGMGKPLAKEHTIENSNYNANILRQIKTHTIGMPGFNSHENDVDLLRHVKTAEMDEERLYIDNEMNSKYKVPEEKLGAKLEKAITRLGKSNEYKDSHLTLPQTIQDTFPHNDKNKSRNYGPSEQPYQENGTQNIRKKRTMSASSLFNALSKQLKKREDSDVDEFYKRMHDAGITSKAALASDNIAGQDHFSHSNFQDLKKETSQKFKTFNTKDSQNAVKRNSMLGTKTENMKVRREPPERKRKDSTFEMSKVNKLSTPHVVGSDNISAFSNVSESINSENSSTQYSESSSEPITLTTQPPDD